mmetsp:Transcript_41831/g.91202  ORF Transcript_41831/g.91202 Transcript_41831/m.91202 type:complete len:273 (-) Transcript_41831:151-969(-)
MQPAPEVDEAGDREEHLSLLKRAVLVQGQPPEIRKGFGWKVYGIVCVLIILCWATTAPFALRAHGVEQFLTRHPNFLFVCWTVLVVQMALHMSVSGIMGACLRTRWIMKHYIWLLQTTPWNSMYIFCHALIMGCILGGTSFSFTRRSMLYVFLAVCGVLALLTVHGIVTRNDYSSAGWKMAIATQILAIALIILRFASHSYFTFRIWTGAWASLVAAMIVMNTQLIFGTARKTPQRLEYTIDMYAYVAFELYQHYFFFYMFSLYSIGDRASL